mmetsp:Transcript_7099/g.11278  ORF Transcript_7099/g.11278 Transcript_7099/m.11278 type:complete len:663 (+) Transcript_7099:433-2421(+)
MASSQQPNANDDSAVVQEIRLAQTNFFKLHNEALGMLVGVEKDPKNHLICSREWLSCLESILNKMAEMFAMTVRCTLKDTAGVENDKVLTNLGSLIPSQPPPRNKRARKTTIGREETGAFQSSKLAQKLGLFASSKTNASRFVDGLPFSKWEHPSPTYPAAISPDSLCTTDQDYWDNFEDQPPPQRPAITHAAENGHLPMIEWLSSNSFQGCTKEAMDLAAFRGHLSVVEWLFTNRAQGCSDQTMDLAAKGGHLAVLEWLSEIGGESCTTDAIDGAAAGGHLAVVEWLNAVGRTSAAMNGAAGGGHLAVVKWLHANSSEGCTTAAMDSAAGGNFLSVVEWLHANRSEGCTTAAMDLAAGGGFLSLVEWLHAYRTEGCTLGAMDLAAGGGHLPVAEWLHAKRSQACTRSAMENAAGGGHLSVVEWLYANRSENNITNMRMSSDGHEFEINTPFHYAAGSGHLTVTKWLFANTGESADDRSIFLDMSTGILAAANGHLATVEWLLRQDAYPSREDVSFVMTNMAARGGHLAVVEWLGKNGAGCTLTAMDWAIQRGHLSVVEWLRCNEQKGDTYCGEYIDYNPSALTIAAKSGYLSTLEWLAANDLPKQDGIIQSFHEKLFFGVGDEEEDRQIYVQLRAAQEKCHLPVIKWILSSALFHISKKYR